MKQDRFRVSIRQGGEPAAMTMEALREVVTEDYRGKSVLVKPNLGFLAATGSGIVTHAEVVRGVVRFMKEAGAKPFIGDSCIFGVNAREAFERAGAAAVAREEGVDIVNLDEGEPIFFDVENPYAVDRVKISSYAVQADAIVTVPVMKTHMYAGVSLSFKNMKGCLFQREKMRFHHLREEARFAPWHGIKNLDRAVADLSSVLYPDLSVLDGIVAMEGMGPILGETKPLGLVMASEDPIAADIAGLFLMGFKPEDIPHVALAAKKRGQVASFEDLDLDRDAFTALRSPFRRAVAEDISAEYPEFMIKSGETCSACEATSMAFLKYYGKRFKGIDQVRIMLGRNIDAVGGADGRCIVLGNCAAAYREMGIFLEGCPPIPSDILKVVEGFGGNKVG